MTETRTWTVVDIDNTIVDTRPSLQGIWQELLGKHVPQDELLRASHVEIFEKYADENHKARAGLLQRRFWELRLCQDEIGVRLTELDRPIANAADTIRQWSLQSSVAYITGRPDTLRNLTLNQLREFRFPLQNATLMMYRLQDYADLRGERLAPMLLQVRTDIFGNFCSEHRVVRVVDDTPSHFTIYREYDVPERIGVRTSLRFSDEDFKKNGATEVVASWTELL